MDKEQISFGLNQTKHLTVIIKTTKNCNLRCKYCSAGEPSKDKLTVEKAITIIDKIAKRSLNSETTLIWHGGEPLMLGLPFYKEVVAFQRQLLSSGYRINNNLQSNGTLITDEWAMFFKENGFRIGLSIDGPKNVNDRTRIFPDGSGTFEKIMHGSKILDKHNLKHGFVVVINQHNFEAIAEIMEFMRQNNKTCKFSVCESLGRAEKNNETSMSALRGKYSDCVLKVFDNWWESGHPADEDVVKTFMHATLLGKSGECTFNENCQESFIAVDYKGDAYPCGRFTDDPRLSLIYNFGNFLTDSFESVWNHPARAVFAKRKEQLSGCQPCEFKDMCNGGCPLSGILNGGIDKPDGHCSDYFKIFSTMKEKVLKEAGIVKE